MIYAVFSKRTTEFYKLCDFLIKKYSVTPVEVKTSYGKAEVFFDKDIKVIYFNLNFTLLPEFICGLRFDRVQICDKIGDDLKERISSNLNF